MKLYHGTSGFSYKEWKGPFYPEDLPNARMLEHYASRLPAVEINNTFYRLPKAEMLSNWRQTVPEEFRFVLKVSQRITHKHRLEGAQDTVKYLIETSESLGPTRGPFLLQLPPYFKKDAERLARFLDEWPTEARAAFEFRHASWFDDEVYDVLRDAGAALCIADPFEVRPSSKEEELDPTAEPPFVATASWGYLRLRRELYTDADLARWAERIRAQEWDDVHVFFKHEDEGAGPRLAARFAQVFEG